MNSVVSGDVKSCGCVWVIGGRDIFCAAHHPAAAYAPVATPAPERERLEPRGCEHGFTAAEDGGCIDRAWCEEEVRLPPERRRALTLAQHRQLIRDTMAGAGRERTARISFLEKKREATKADLLLKFEDGDWHGVADAAMDLRDIDSELKGLRL